MGRKRAGIEVDRGSGNVFRDFGVPDARSRQLRVELAAEILSIIRERGLSQRETSGWVTPSCWAMSTWRRPWL